LIAKPVGQSASVEPSAEILNMRTKSMLNNMVVVALIQPKIMIKIIIWSWSWKKSMLNKNGLHASFCTFLAYIFFFTNEDPTL
jgi:hypothetical protein